MFACLFSPSKMSVDLANIIDEHRKDLMRRLLSKNRLLSFGPTVRNRIDVCDIFPENGLIVFEDKQTDDGISNPDDFLKKLANSGEDGTKIKINRIAGQFLKPLKDLQDNAHNHYRSTGNWPLCLGWPLFYVPRDGQSPHIAPLLLWKIAIKVVGNDATFKLYEKDAYFNFMLQAWHEKEYSLPFDWQNNDVPFEKLAEKIEKSLKKWGYGNNNCKFDGNLDAIKKYSKQDFDCPTVIPCATIGSANFNYQPLLEELKVLSKKAGAGEGLGLLKNLLSSETGKSESTGSPSPPKESDKWLIADSDSTQESSVWRAREEEIMLIDGPPGTGKSQTIVNLIADAAQRGRDGMGSQNGMKIALVCHKKPALDVVYKRLEAAGWQNIVAQINNPIKERQDFIKCVRNLPPVNPLFGTSTSATSSREDLCKLIIENEEVCKKSNVTGNYSIRGDLRAKIFRVNEENNFSPYNLLDNFRRIIGNDIEQEQMNSLVEQCRTLADDWSSCNYPNNPWQEVQEDWPLAKQAQLAMAIGILCKQYDEIKNHRDLLPSEKSIMFAQNYMAKHFHSFYGPQKHEAVKSLMRLMADDKSMFSLVNMTARHLWRNLYGGADENQNPYIQYQDSINDIGKIQSIKRRLREQEIWWTLTRQKFATKHWADNLLSIICALRCENIQPVDFYQHALSLSKLKKALANKAEMDKKKILSMFSKQNDSVQKLSQQDLLRQRAGGGHPATTLRRLYHRGQSEVWNVFPILLTNPNSASQFLPFEPGVLDLAIIDEASQMFTADAMPIFYRAKKIIISGDDKQMPPSDLFTALRNDGDGNDSGDEDEQDDEDIQQVPKGAAPAEGRYELLEATKHLLLSRGQSINCRLEVHYRSRPSELIAFSNHAFYGGTLQAAPSNGLLMAGMKNPIEMTDVNGNFEKGVNKAEIHQIILKLKEMWEEPAPLSVGVIVFNKTQADELASEINKECARDDDFRNKYESACQKTDDGEDIGFFIRNVENVQGDERDIIILGTTYGTQSRNYGPLNEFEKGRRRLNVAITRAKYGMFVITSLNIDDISNHGERPGDGGEQGRERWYLWMFMKYARAVSNSDKEVAADILRELNDDYNPMPIGKKPDSEFEIQVAEFLRNEGYVVDYQIGESGFRIDLGVKKNQGDPCYLCGVECDGRAWHSGWRARHNDIWRQKILESKGWKIIRIWSDEWFTNPKQGGKYLLAKIKKIEEK